MSFVKPFCSFALALTLAACTAENTSVSGTASASGGDSATGGENETSSGTSGSTASSGTSGSTASAEDSDDTVPTGSSTSGDTETGGESSCGCSASIEDDPSIACSEVPQACEPLDLFCDADISIVSNVQECMAVVQLLDSDLQSLDCLLSFIQDPSEGVVSLRVTALSGFTASTRTFHVDAAAVHTAINFDAKDVEGFYFVVVGGDPASAAGTCLELQDPNERLQCAFDAFAVGEPIECGL